MPIRISNCPESGHPIQKEPLGRPGHAEPRCQALGLLLSVRLAYQRGVGDLVDAVEAT